MSCGQPFANEENGAVLSLAPSKVVTKTVGNLASREMASAVTNIIATNGKKCFNWFSTNGTRAACETTTKKVTQVAEKQFAREAGKLSTSDLVIQETLKGRGQLASRYKLSANEALDTGMQFLGKNYRQIGKPGDGVFRSADGLRQFRIDSTSLVGKHDPYVPHVHLEAFKLNSTKPFVNNHIHFYD